MKKIVDLIHQAQVYEVSNETPLDYAKNLSKRLKNNLYLKREDLQSVFSFKIRGAYNKIIHLSDIEKSNGIIAASAGNHAQGVALSAQKLKLKAIIVMPKTTPTIKVKAVQSYGAQTILIGDSFDDAYAHALSLVKTHGYTYIPPYDDPYVIAGQGTIGLELLKQHPHHIDAIFIPTGGGGLLAGVGALIKALSPHTKIICVEPEGAACMTAALHAKKRVTLDKINLFADGVAVKQAGELPYKIALETVDECITVTTDEICAAIKDCFDDTRAIIEPAGALGIAGAKKFAKQHPERKAQNWIAINSGANMNFDRLKHIAERAEIGEYREALLGVTIPEKPGSFKTFCKQLGKRSITEFNYRFSTEKEAHIFVGIELQKGLEEKNQIINFLKEKHFPVLDLTDNEMAKLHLRHMVGGRAPSLKNEVLFRFEFPERPGALIQFLEGIGQNWNITLFHYRNHGSAYGRVLVGLDMTDKKTESLTQFLESLGYPYTSETENSAYKLFL